SLIFGTIEVSGKAFRAGGYAGEWLAKLLNEDLHRVGSGILILTLIVLAVIVSTQFSFGRLFAAVTQMIGGAFSTVWDGLGEWRENRRRARQRLDVIAKHSKKPSPSDSPPLLNPIAEPPPKRTKPSPPAA